MTLGKVSFIKKNLKGHTFHRGNLSIEEKMSKYEGTDEMSQANKYAFDIR
jgi:hypothetical protein